MKKNYYAFKAKDGSEIKYIKRTLDNADCVLLVVHDMNDYSMRYNDFASFMNENNIAVYAQDIRGHGENTDKNGNLGSFPSENGWNIVVDDLDIMVKIISEENPDKKIILLSQGMGTLLARTYAYKYGDNIDKLIMLSTYKLPSFFSPIFSLRLKVLCARKDMNFISEPLNKKLVASMSKKEKFDRLCSADEERKKIAEDPKCNILYSLSFFKSLYDGYLKSINRENLSYIPTKLPVYILNGKNDAIAGYENGASDIYGLLRSEGLENISLKFYNNLKHDILHEKEKFEVYEDILEIIKK